MEKGAEAKDEPRIATLLSPVSEASEASGTTAKRAL